MGDSKLRSLIDGRGGNDTIIGGASNDWLSGWEGADSIAGLAGDDYIQATGWSIDGPDTIDGGEGYDTVGYVWWARDQAVVFTSLRVPGASSYTQVDPLGGVDVIQNIERVDIQGGRQADTLTGDTGENELRGNQGADTLAGGGGDDYFIYDATSKDNNVLVDVGQPADLIKDFSAGDSIRVWNWAPKSLLSSGQSSALTAGQALVLAGTNEVTLHLGVDATAGADISVRLQGVTSPSQVQMINQSSWGEFVLSAATDGNDTINGTSRADSINGLGGNDVINGFDGNDSLSGGAGNDTINGGLGGDRFYLGQDAGADVIDGGGYVTRNMWPSRLTVPNNGDDYDRLSYREASGGIALDLTSRTVTAASAGTDTYTNVEEVYGSPGKDTVTGRASQGSSFFFGVWAVATSSRRPLTVLTALGRRPERGLRLV